MKNQELNKNASKEDLELIFDSIIDLNKDLNVLATEIFKIETDKKLISKPSIFIFSAINRAILLNNGYLSLAKENNNITAVNLLRLQADNCMRIYAISLVENRAEFFDNVIKGIHIRNMKDTDGNKMTDEFLATQLDKIFKGFKTLYKNTSGFIHFSNEHLNLNRKVTSNEQTMTK